MRKAKAWAPAGLSGFFVPKVTSDLRTTGAAGGGVGIEMGVSVEVRVYESEQAVVENYINGHPLKSGLVEYILKRLLEKNPRISPPYKIVVDQRISVPIGGGYGTSGASALAVSIALAKALRARVTLNDIATIAHEADIVNKTGLGTVVGILGCCGGIVIVEEPGGPGIAKTNSIMLEDDLRILTLFYGARSKETILSNAQGLKDISNIGSKALEKILEDPTPETFIEQCRWFAEATGLMTPAIKEVVRELEKTRGVLGVSMTMIGDAVFAIVEEEEAEEALKIASQVRKPVWTYVGRPFGWLLNGF